MSKQTRYYILPASTLHGLDPLGSIEQVNEKVDQEFDIAAAEGAVAAEIVVVEEVFRESGQQEIVRTRTQTRRRPRKPAAAASE